MSNFDVQVRVNYRDIPGLVLDLRSEDLTSDEGTHDGANNAAVLTDTSKSWAVNALIGMVAQNITDGSYAAITANTATTVTGTLAGGTDDNWDIADAYSIVGDSVGRLEWPNSAPAARYPKAEVYEGTHDGALSEPILTDSTQDWVVNSLVGMVIRNITDGSHARITSNTNDDVAGTLAGGVDDDWDPGDVYEIRDPRFGNPYQTIAAEQPVVRTVGGARLMEFTRTRLHELNLPLDDTLPLTWLTAAVEMFKGADNTNDQVILDISDLRLTRRNAAGNYSFTHGGAEIAGAGDQPDDMWLLQALPATTQARYFRNGVSQLLGAAAAVDIPAGDPAGAIGSISGSDYFDGQIRTLKLWDRHLSPLEIDFAYRTLTFVLPYNQDPRCTMRLKVWTDDTGDFSRLNPQAAASHKFVHATYVVEVPPRRVHISATVGGIVRPDSEMGGNLFQVVPIEYPSASPPLIYQDSGWSSVFDVGINTEGHYSYMMWRPGGGGVIVHFDAELF